MFGPKKKNNVVIAIFVGLLLVVVVLVAIFSGRHEHDPKDLSYRMRTGAAKDWSSEGGTGRAAGAISVWTRFDSHQFHDHDRQSITIVRYPSNW